MASPVVLNPLVIQLFNRNMVSGKLLLDKALLSIQLREKYKLELPLDEETWGANPSRFNWLFQQDVDRSPWVTAQFAAVVLTTTTHTAHSSLYDDTQKLQIHAFVEELIRCYKERDSRSWRLSRQISSIGIDGWGIGSLAAGFAHTNDFHLAMKKAEKLSGAWLRPVPWYASFAPIHGVLAENYIQNLAWELGGTASIFTIGMMVQPYLQTVLWERNRQYRNYLEKEKRETEIRIFDLLRMGIITPDHNPKLITDHVNWEVKKFAIPKFLDMLNQSKTASRVVLSENYGGTQF